MNWFKYLTYERARLEETVRFLKEENDLLWKNIQSPLECVALLLGRPIKWVDTDKMEYAEKVYWYNEAQSLLKNKVFQSIAGKTENGERLNGEAVKDLIEFIARSAKTEREMDYWRAKIAGVELVREMAESIIDPSKNVEDDNINDVI